MNKSILWLAIGTLLLTSCAEKVYLFNAKISSLDVNGTKKYGPKNSANISPLIKDPLLADPEFQYLGRLISSKNLRDNNGFLDFIFLKGNYGQLDEVYINFIDQAILPNLQVNDAEGINSSLLSEFKTDFNNETAYAKRKELLFKDKFVPIRNKVEKSVYRTISNDVVQDQKIASSFKGGLEANVKSVLKESSGEISGDVKAQIESMVKSDVNIKGKYVDIEIRQEFLDMLIALLRQLKFGNITPDNNFLINYLDRFVGKNDLVACGYSLLQFEINYNTTKINRDSIGAIVNAIATLSPDAKTKLTGKVYASFSSSKDFSGESKSVKNYLVRYSYNNTIQGERPANPEQKILSSTPAAPTFKLSDVDNSTVSNDGTAFTSLHLKKNSRYRIRGNVSVVPVDYGSGYFEGRAILTSPELNLRKDLGWQLRKDGEPDSAKQFPFDLGMIDTDDKGVYTFITTLTGMKWSNSNKDVRPQNYKVTFSIDTQEL